MRTGMDCVDRKGEPIFMVDLNYLNIITGKSGVGKSNLLKSLYDAERNACKVEMYDTDTLKELRVTDSLIRVMRQLFPKFVSIKWERRTIVNGIWMREQTDIVVEMYIDDVITEIPLEDMGRTFKEMVRFVMVLEHMAGNPYSMIFVDDFRCLDRSFSNNLLDYIREICIERDCQIFMVCDSDESLSTLVWGANYSNRDKYSFITIHKLERYKGKSIIRPAIGADAVQAVQLGLGQY